MMNSPQEVYSVLYDIAAENMAKNNMEFEYSKEAFLFATECKPGEADILQMSNLDNMSFIQALYIALFFRTCDTGALAIWQKNRMLTQNEFRKKAVNSLMRSQEFFDKGAVVINNLYSSGAEANREVVVVGTAGVTSANKALNKLYRFYKGLPTPIRNLIRKILGIK